MNCGTALAPVAPERWKLATLVFCDLSGSTAMGERLDAEAVRSLMLSYFHEMRGALERHGGTVEKFVGDAVLAVFGVPEAHEDDGNRGDDRPPAEGVTSLGHRQLPLEWTRIGSSGLDPCVRRTGRHSTTSPP